VLASLAAPRTHTQAVLTPNNRCRVVVQVTEAMVAPAARPMVMPRSRQVAHHTAHRRGRLIMEVVVASFITIKRLGQAMEEPAVDVCT